MVLNGYKNQINAIQQSLSSWGGQRILITKEENGDLDQTILNLERVEMDENHFIDDYTPDHSIQLVGNGQTVFEHGNMPLPYQSYDIPIENIYKVSADQGRILIRTDRGTYTITTI